jgi:hypothetical protein
MDRREEKSLNFRSTSDLMRYSFKARGNKKVHRLNPATRRTFCKVENGGVELIQADTFPNGRSECALCTRATINDVGYTVPDGNSSYSSRTLLEH